eukprot:scaffold24905_cov18-Tisochrysis_lutea.AAC.1
MGSANPIPGAATGVCTERESPHDEQRGDSQDPHRTADAVRDETVSAGSSLMRDVPIVCL